MERIEIDGWMDGSALVPGTYVAHARGFVFVFLPFWRHGAVYSVLPYFSFPFLIALGVWVRWEIPAPGCRHVDAPKRPF
jgi:hypothetical protein